MKKDSRIVAEETFGEKWGKGCFVGFVGEFVGERKVMVVDFALAFEEKRDQKEWEWQTSLRRKSHTREAVVRGVARGAVSRAEREVVREAERGEIVRGAVECS